MILLLATLVYSLLKQGFRKAHNMKRKTLGMLLKELYEYTFTSQISHGNDPGSLK